MGEPLSASAVFLITMLEVDIVPEKMEIRLVVLDDAEYVDFSEKQVIEHAHQRVRAGEWTSDQALGRAREALTKLLADKLRDSGHFFLKGVRTDGTCVGWLWVAPAPAFLGDNCEDKRWLSQITVAEALRVCTINGAFASFEEKTKGSITPGKLADYVMLEKDPHKVDPDRIKQIKILATVVGGKTVA